MLRSGAVARRERPTAGSSQQFEQEAQAALRFAEEEAQRLGAEHVGTEHLLLGLMRDVEGISARVLRQFGVGNEPVLSAVELMATTRPIGGGWRAATRVTRAGEQPQGGEITPTPAATSPTWSLRANKAIELAEDDARQLNHSHVETGHLLLGLIREADNMATGLLASLGVRDLGVVRARVLEAFGQRPSS
jgi:ATP-dependent Clp protease ATP-binding subunit ClpC